MTSRIQAAEMLCVLEACLQLSSPDQEPVEASVMVMTTTYFYLLLSYRHHGCRHRIHGPSRATMNEAEYEASQAASLASARVIGANLLVEGGMDSHQ
jgi:hypothetical protein